MVWYTTNCQFCNKSVKCNASTLGTSKIQLKKHEDKCAINHNLSNANTNYLITQNDINMSIHNMINTQPIIQQTTPQPITQTTTQTTTRNGRRRRINQPIPPIPPIPPTAQLRTILPIQPVNLNSSTHVLINNPDIEKYYNNKYYRSQFNKLEWCFIWDNGDGLWNVYSKESQYILNNAEQDSIVQIYEYKYYSHNDIFTRFTIVIDLKNETQQITYNNTVPVTYNRARSVKKVPIKFAANIIKHKKDKYFYDPYQDISYTFSREKIVDLNSINIELSCNDNSITLADLNINDVVKKLISKIKLFEYI